MGLWLLWAIPAAIVTTLTGWAAFGKGKNARAVRRSAKRARHKVWMGTKTRAKATHQYYRAKRAATPRGQLRAKRRSQPNRWTWGNVRTEDDPTRTRRAARYAGTHAKAAGTGVLGKAKAAGTGVLNRRKLRKANAAPKVRRNPIELLSGSHVSGQTTPKGGSGLTCGAPTGKRHDGPPCQNIPMLLPDGTYAGSCYIRSHRDWSAQTGQAQSQQGRNARPPAASKPSVDSSAQPPQRPVASKPASSGLESWVQETARKAPTKPAPAPKPKAPKPAAPKAPKPLVTDRDEPVARPPVFHTTNVASSGFTPVQAGRVTGGRAKPQASTRKTPPATPPKTPTGGTSRSGNYAAPGSQVGVQADNVVGGVNVTMAGRRVVTGRTVNRSAGDMFVTGGKPPKAPKPPKPAKDKTPNAADVDQSTTTNIVGRDQINVDGTLNIRRGSD